MYNLNKNIEYNLNLIINTKLKNNTYFKLHNTYKSCDRRILVKSNIIIDFIKSFKIREVLRP